MLWHEGVAGRKKEDIISVFHCFFLQRRYQKGLIWWLNVQMLFHLAKCTLWTIFSGFFLEMSCRASTVILHMIAVNYLQDYHDHHLQRQSINSFAISKSGISTFWSNVLLQCLPVATMQYGLPLQHSYACMLPWNSSLLNKMTKMMVNSLLFFVSPACWSNQITNDIRSNTGPR